MNKLSTVNIHILCIGCKNCIKMSKLTVECAREIFEKNVFLLCDVVQQKKINFNKSNVCKVRIDPEDD